MYPQSVAAESEEAIGQNYSSKGVRHDAWIATAVGDVLPKYPERNIAHEDYHGYDMEQLEP